MSDYQPQGKLTSSMSEFVHRNMRANSGFLGGGIGAVSFSPQLAYGAYGVVPYHPLSSGVPMHGSSGGYYDSLTDVRIRPEGGGEYSTTLPIPPMNRSSVLSFGITDDGDVVISQKPKSPYKQCEQSYCPNTWEPVNPGCIYPNKDNTRAQTTDGLTHIPVIASRSLSSDVSSSGSGYFGIEYSGSRQDRVITPVVVPQLVHTSATLTELPDSPRSYAQPSVRSAPPSPTAPLTSAPATAPLISAPATAPLISAPATAPSAPPSSTAPLTSAPATAPSTDPPVEMLCVYILLRDEKNVFIDRFVDSIFPRFPYPAEDIREELVRYLQSYTREARDVRVEYIMYEDIRVKYNEAYVMIVRHDGIDADKLCRELKLLQIPIAVIKEKLAAEKLQEEIQVDLAEIFWYAAMGGYLD